MPRSKILRIFGFYKVCLLDRIFKLKKLYIELKTAPKHIRCAKCGGTDFIFYGKKNEFIEICRLGAGNSMLSIIGRGLNVQPVVLYPNVFGSPMTIVATPGDLRDTF